MCFGGPVSFFALASTLGSSLATPSGTHPTPATPTAPTFAPAITSVWRLSLAGTPFRRPPLTCWVRVSDTLFPLGDPSVCGPAGRSPRQLLLSSTPSAGRPLWLREVRLFPQSDAAHMRHHSRNARRRAPHRRPFQGGGFLPCACCTARAATNRRIAEILRVVIMLYCLLIGFVSFAIFIL